VSFNFQNYIKLKYFLILIFGIGLIVLYFLVNPRNVELFPKCPLYVTTGIYCPGCGSQRAIHHLLNFNFYGVVQQNILFIFGLLIIIYFWTIKGLNLIFNKKYYNYIYHPKTPIIILIFVVLFWILRNISYYPFNLLSPL